MDKLKFRVFDEQEKRWTYGFLTQNGELCNMPDVYAPDFDGDDEHMKILDANRYEVNRCTGLKDKNGKLIYENDVLEDWEGYKIEIGWAENLDTWGYVRFQKLCGWTPFSGVENEYAVINTVYGVKFEGV